MNSKPQPNVEQAVHQSIQDLLSLPKDLMAVADQFHLQSVRNSIVFFGSARIHSEEASKAQLQQLLDHPRPNDPTYIQSLQTAQGIARLSTYYTQAEALAFRLTQWTLQHPEPLKRFLVCSGGGPGIMQACNQGAHRAGGKSIGLSISLPREQSPNLYVTPDLHFKFDTFMLRKFWFFYFIKALVVFPGGFGTLDEVFEVLTLMATQKINYPLPFIFFGSEYWNEVLNFKALVRHGTIHPSEMECFKFIDSVDEAYTYLTTELERLYLRSL